MSEWKNIHPVLRLNKKEKERKKNNQLMLAK
jgi:hypothetical protein